MESMPDAVTVREWLDGWSRDWNRGGSADTRRGLLSFLVEWRDRPGEWLGGNALRFYPLVTESDLPPGEWEDNFYGDLRKLHFANHAIWHFEDEARREDVPDRTIVLVKRGIDAVNQQRNDQMERIDRHVVRRYGGEETDRDLPLHSEPPGLMLDRISILSLKIHHCRGEERPEEEATLRRQRRELTEAFERLAGKLERGEVRVTVYRQFKTYNDPDTNPALRDRGKDR